MQLPDALLNSGPSWRTILAGTAIFAAGFLVRGVVSHSPEAGVIRSPRTTLLPKLSKEEQLSLPYPPDVFPGARDIETPFGTFRVYEWGPENGRKVLLVHGISTPCLSLGGIAHALVKKGCRVMLFDLPGRGYSDTPIDIEHDVRLFISQILLVLATSSLSWSAATGGFALVGYSLGGGISASFASYLPEMVNSLVLITPSGLIREHNFSRSSRILYSKGVIPEPLLHRLVRRRLQKPLSEPGKRQPENDENAGGSKIVKGEVNIEGNAQVVLSKSHPNITLEAAVHHQIQSHEGFVHAFMSSIRYGPISREHDRWEKIGKRLTTSNQESQTKTKVLIVLGESDPIIVHDEIREDATRVFENNVEIEVLIAGHEVPITKADDVTDIIWKHWERFPYVVKSLETK